MHIAPGAGAEDFALSKEYGLDVIAPLDEDGTYLVGPHKGLRTGFGPFEGKFAGDVTQEVFDSLRDKGLLYRVQDYTHRYPTCWRCGSELVFRLVDEWFISMDGPKESGQRSAVSGQAGPEVVEASTSRDVRPAASDRHRAPLREQIMEVTRKARWIPEFGLPRELDWLKNMHDWMISKKRYYGLALPIFECAECGRFEVIGSEAELKERAVEGWEQFEGHSPHRPYVDPVRIACSGCGAKVARIKDVGNPWLDAGIVPFSTLHYNDPSTDRQADYWRKWFPADWVSESFPGQFRNWFYALLSMGTVMVQGTEFEGQPPFKSLFSYALVRDEKGEEMHKSKGNAIWFDDAAERMGADVMRWMFFRAPPPTNLAFGWHAGDEIKRGFLSTLWNTYSFFVTYANIDGWTPTLSPDPSPIKEREHRQAGTRPLGAVGAEPAGEGRDRGPGRIRLHERHAADRGLRRGAVELVRAPQPPPLLEVRGRLRQALRLRDPMGLPGDDRTPAGAFLAVPGRGHVAESDSAGSRQQATGNRARRACTWRTGPWPTRLPIDRELQDSVRLVQRLASLGRSARAKANVKVRQPLQKVYVKVQSPKEGETVRLLADQLIEELNVKEVGLIEDEAEFFDYQVRPNLPLLGPKLRTAGRRAAARAGRGGQGGGRQGCRRPAGRSSLDGFTLEPAELLVTTSGQGRLCRRRRGRLRRCRDHRDHAGAGGRGPGARAGAPHPGDAQGRRLRDLGPHPPRLRRRRRHRSRHAGLAATTSRRRRWRRRSRRRRHRRARTSRSTRSTGAR